jgi:hypothetical protein
MALTKCNELNWPALSFSLGDPIPGQGSASARLADARTESRTWQTLSTQDDMAVSRWIALKR